ncbi:Ribonuclease H domain - like 10 [Theobroma cacao]|nr:Ribonuclease H domain - like 10 [Theobroma cacao]
MDPANKYHDLVTKGFAHSLGKGTTISFWEDLRADDSTLATKFPHIHALAISKKATIAEMGSWVKGNWRTLKLNTDGVAKGKPGLAGNEGVIRDHHGFIRETFSENIGIQDSNFVKFYAIREGISLFFSSPWVTTHSLVVENDSANAINWVQHHCKVLWRMKNTLNSIETFLRRSTRFTFK